MNTIPLRITPKGTKRNRPFQRDMNETLTPSPPAKVTLSGRISQRPKMYSKNRGGIYGTKIST